jgi:cleavage and polyadenylation specificity factor subunit 3
MLYSETDLDNSMSKIDTINFHQEVDIEGVKFWCYHAGHVLGAAMFMIEIAGVRVLYTGDFSRVEDRHLMAAELPTIKPDVLIIEATYGVNLHEDRDHREKRFTDTVRDIVTRGGKCLIPVFALGRAQELLLILDEYWSMHPELHDIPIYYASSLAKKCMAVYQTYVNAMNEKIRKQIGINNPFVFKHISNLKTMDEFDDIGPCVVMASPGKRLEKKDFLSSFFSFIFYFRLLLILGMMQSGLSRELFESWCPDKKNGVIIAGYCVEGTLAKMLLNESPSEITSMSGQKIKVNCTIEYISFSAHTDFKQTSQFVRSLKPAHIILVHGEQSEMQKLKDGLIRQYEDTDYNIQVYNPRNTQPVELYFRGEKSAKVVGKLAANTIPKLDTELSGILVKRNFKYHLVSPDDLHNYTDLVISTILQRQSVPFKSDPDILLNDLQKVFGDYKRTNESQANNRIRILNSIDLIFEKNFIVLEVLFHDLFILTFNAIADVLFDLFIV